MPICVIMSVILIGGSIASALTWALYGFWSAMGLMVLTWLSGAIVRDWLDGHADWLLCRPPRRACVVAADRDVPGERPRRRNTSVAQLAGQNPSAANAAGGHFLPSRWRRRVRTSAASHWGGSSWARLGPAG